MYPLVLCSLATWAIALERIYTLHKMDQQTQALSAALEKSSAGSSAKTSLEACMRSTAPVARAMEEIIKNDANLSPDRLQQKAQRRRLELNQEYKKYLWVLGTIGSATPFLGLFGTVVGILRAFKNIASTGEAGFAVVAAEISEALVATAAGIIVAVIAVALFNYFQVKANKVALASRLALEECLEVAQGSRT